jgi:hypothetical protein
MKKVAFVLLLPLLLLVAARNLPAEDTRGKGDRTVEAEKIVVKSKDGEHTLTIQALDHGVGLWVSGPRGNVVMLSQLGQSPYVGLHDGKAAGCPWAVFLDGGEPVLQTVRKGTVTQRPAN